ncbi:SUKH-3 domain-containing protein (plasmid) [Deinococcus radiomollis]|uniref:SUKH-3 domain-containing protein n=1 Tax=Deinococcus radiomollis TaxID=468916 RepID=UPI003892C585
MLKNAGWTEDRKVDIDAKIVSLEKRGWKVFSTARDFAAQFCGIQPINIDGKSTIYFSELNDEAELDVAVDWKKSTGENIFPIGIYGLVGLFIEETGKIYDNVEDVGLMSLLGEDVFTGLYNLFFGEAINTVTYEFSG